MQEIDISQIIRCAQRTPSGDNSQPFHFVFEDKTLFIYHDSEIANHILNYHNTVSLITLGCIMELIEISASNQSYSVAWSLFDLPSDKDGVAAAATFTKNETLIKDSLFPYISDRICDREVYLKKPLTHEVLNSLRSEAQNFSSLHWQILTDFTDELMTYIKNSELSLWDRPHVVNDIFRWVRWNQKSYQKNASGLYWRELGAKFYEFPVLLLIRIFPWIPLVFIRMGLGFLFKNVVARNVKSSSGLLLVSGVPNKNSSLTDVGRFVMRTWLTLTKYGFVMQPLSIQSISIYWIHIQSASSELNSKNEKLFRDGELLLKKSFQVPSELCPIWMLRFGKPKNSKIPSLRKPLNKVLVNKEL